MEKKNRILGERLFEKVPLRIFCRPFYQIRTADIQTTLKRWDDLGDFNQTIVWNSKTNMYDVSRICKAEFVQPEGGTVTPDNDAPVTGEEVTVTVTPDEGKAKDKVIVRDENGGEISITDQCC